MVRKIFEKAGMVPGLQPGHRPAVDSPGGNEAAKPRTAPGTMMGFLTAQSAAVQEAEQLKDRVKALEGEAPLRKLDPARIKPSKWANRHEASFKTVEFEELKAEIARLQEQYKDEGQFADPATWPKGGSDGPFDDKKPVGKKSIAEAMQLTAASEE